MNKFVRNLKFILKSLNMTQKELAKKLKVTDVTVSRWMMKLNSPSIATCEKIAKILGVQLSDLFE